jgi:hypothetical protein
MNSDILAAIIKKYGRHVAGGEHELFVPSVESLAIPKGSTVRSYRDVQRDGIVFRLSQTPIIIDIAAAVTDVEGNPIARVPPQTPP